MATTEKYTTVIELNAEQAKRNLDELRKKVESWKSDLAEAREKKMGKNFIAAIRKELTAAEKELKKYDNEVARTIDTMNNIGKASIEQIEDAQKSLLRLSKEVPHDSDAYKNLTGMLDQVTQELENIKATKAFEQLQMEAAGATKAAVHVLQQPFAASNQQIVLVAFKHRVPLRELSRSPCLHERVPAVLYLFDNPPYLFPRHCNTRLRSLITGKHVLLPPHLVRCRVEDVEVHIPTLRLVKHRVRPRVYYFIIKGWFLGVRVHFFTLFAEATNAAVISFILDFVPLWNEKLGNTHSKRSLPSRSCGGRN